MIESKKLRQLDNGNYLDSHGKEVRAAEYVALLVPKKQKWTRGEYMLGLQKSFVEIAKMGLSGEQMSVLMLLMAKTDFENYIHITQDEMAKELDLKRPNVTRAVNARACKNFCVNGHLAGNCRAPRSDDGRSKESSTEGVAGQPAG